MRLVSIVLPDGIASSFLTHARLVGFYFKGLKSQALLLHAELPGSSGAFGSKVSGSPGSCLRTEVGLNENQ
jgi:hypothetical protein